MARWSAAGGSGFHDGFSGLPLHWVDHYDLIADPSENSSTNSPLRAGPDPEETDRQLLVPSRPTIAVSHPRGEEPDPSALVSLVREPTDQGVLHVMEVRRRRGRADLTRAPTTPANRYRSAWRWEWRPLPLWEENMPWALPYAPSRWGPR